MRVASVGRYALIEITFSLEIFFFDSIKRHFYIRTHLSIGANSVFRRHEHATVTCVCGNERHSRSLSRLSLSLLFFLFRRKFPELIE